jgi:hypothetical protein
MAAMRVRKLILGMMAAMVSSCGYIDNPNLMDEVGEGSGDSTTETGDTTTETGPGLPPEAPVLELSLAQVKQFDFDWGAAVATRQRSSFMICTSAQTSFPKRGDRSSITSRTVAKLGELLT